MQYAGHTQQQKSCQQHRQMAFAHLETGGKQVNAKSLMGVMTLGAEGAPEILVRANGADETEAVQAVVRYLETRQG